MIIDKLLAYAIEKTYPTAKWWENFWVGNPVDEERKILGDAEILEWKVEGVEPPLDIAELVSEFRVEFETTELAREIRTKRDVEIAQIEERLSRYERQLKLGVKTTDDEGWYYSALEYVQELRDVPQQAGFPHEINWPIFPEN